MDEICRLTRGLFKIRISNGAVGDRTNGKVAHHVNSLLNRFGAIVMAPSQRSLERLESSLLQILAVPRTDQLSSSV